MYNTNTCVIIDGKFHAEELLLKLTDRISKLKLQHNIHPCLAVILLGNDPASITYVNNKIKKAQEIGIGSKNYRLDYNTSEQAVIDLLHELNNDYQVNGILIQLPLPKHINTQKLLNYINPQKDVDGFHINNIGLLNSWQDSLEPCTPQGALILIKKVFGNNLSGKKAVILGRSSIVGRPMASMLIRENCTVTVLNSKSLNIINECKTADILVTAVGKAQMIKKDAIKPGACVIDVGIIKVNEKLYGDVDFSSAAEVAGYLTPVPGGVGPMTVACLLFNTIKATCLQHNIK